MKCRKRNKTSKQNEREENIMKKASANTGQRPEIFGLILSLGLMPLLLGVTGCTTAKPLQQSTGEQMTTATLLPA